MSLAITFKDFMGALAVAITLVAYGIYVWQTLRGEARPHPLSWLIFGILTGTAYLVQRDEAAGAGSWVMGVTAVVCLLLCLMSFWRGERVFPWYEWAFLARRRHHLHILSVVAAADDRGGARGHRQRARLRPDADQSLAAPALRQRHHVRAQQHRNSCRRSSPWTALTVATCVMPAALVVAQRRGRADHLRAAALITKYRHPEVRAKRASKDAGRGACVHLPLRRASAAMRRNSAATSALLPAGAPSRPGVQ